MTGAAGLFGTRRGRTGHCGFGLDVLRDAQTMGILATAQLSKLGEESPLKGKARRSEGVRGSDGPLSVAL